MIEIKKLKHLKNRYKQLYEKGVKASEQQNPKYAIEMFRDLLKHEPGVMEVRQKLRELQLQKVGNQADSMSHNLAVVKSALNLMKGSSLIKKGKFNEALANAEAAMTNDPTCPQCLTLLAKAAEAAEAHLITMTTLETALQFHPKSVEMVDWLARTCAVMGLGQKAIECREKLVRIDKANLAKHKASLEKLEKEVESDNIDPESYVQMDTGDNIEGTVNKNAVQSQIEQQESSLAKKDSPEGRKKLGDLCVLAGDYEKALENYFVAVELTSGMDPSLENAIDTAFVKKFDASVKEWRDYREHPEVAEEERAHADEQIQQVNQEKWQTLIGRCRERVQRNPHEGKYQFQLAGYLWQSGDVGEAISNLEQLKNNQKYRELSLFFLARCYESQGNYQKAVETFQALIDLIPRMNRTARSAYYALGKTYEAMNNEEEAGRCFKTVYAVDENFKDVSAIIDRIYQKEQLSDF